MFYEAWSLSAAGTVARHEYRFDAAVEQGEQITSGNEIDTAPRDIHAMRLRYDAARLQAVIEWLHVGGYWANAANTALRRSRPRKPSSLRLDREELDADAARDEPLR